VTWDEQRAAAAVQTLMHDENVPPMSIDVGAAVLAGRRGAQRRTAVYAGLALVAVLGISAIALRPAGHHRTPQPSTASPQPSRPWTAAAIQPLTCTPAPFGEHPDQDPIIGVDPTGRYVLANPGLQGVKLARYADGVPTVFDVPKGLLESAAINRAGDVAGSSTTVGDVAQSLNTAHDPPFSVWVYRGGELRALPLPAGYPRAEGVVMNGRGDVAATVRSGNTSAVALWLAAAPDQPRVYPTGFAGHVEAIGEDGSVLANPGPGSPSSQLASRLWSPDGTGRDLTVPPGWTSAEAWAFNDSWAIGYVRTAGPSAQRAFAPARWNTLTGEVQVLPGTEQLNQAQVPGLNALPTGWFVAGNGNGRYGGMGLRGAIVIAPDGRVFSLSVPGGTETQYGIIKWISGDGRKMLSGLRDATQANALPRATIWSCDPGR
jgi:hypothetical protein